MTGITSNMLLTSIVNGRKKIPEKMCVWEILDKHNSWLLELNVLELKYVLTLHMYIISGVFDITRKNLEHFVPFFKTQLMGPDLCYT